MAKTAWKKASQRGVQSERNHKEANGGFWSRLRKNRQKKPKKNPYAGKDLRASGEKGNAKNKTPPVRVDY